MRPEAGPPGRILVVGDALLDVAITLTEPMRPGGDVPAAIRLGPGGQGANLAVRLARRGLRVTLACGLGEDAAGRLLRDALEAEGVALQIVKVPATGTVGVLLDRERDRTMLSQRAAFDARLDAAALDGASWAVVSGYVLAGEGRLELGSGHLQEAPRRAVLGCSLAAGAEAGWLAAVESLHPDLLVLSADEARALAPDGQPERAAEWLAWRVGGVVIVTAHDRAVASVDGVHVEAAAPSPASAVLDSTGAGDAFAAALIGELADATHPPDAQVLRAGLEAALAVAREVVAVHGAQGRVRSEGGAPAAGAR